MNDVKAAVAALCLTATGCGLNMQQHYQNYRPNLLNREWDEAAQYIESEKESFYGAKNRLLFYFDKAMVLHLGGRYQESNAVLEQAKTAAEELWTESIAEHAASWFTTDNSLSYAGEDFEKVLLHFVAAENYISLGDYSAARVEARQITDKLELYNLKYEQLAEGKNVYKDDGFARWLAGMLSETEGVPGTQRSALNDAWIDYKKAIDVYAADYGRYGTAVPQQLLADALRTLSGLGADFRPELDALRARYPTQTFVPYAEAVKKGRVVLIHSAGEAPTKTDDFWTHREGKHIIRIAFPKFVAKKHTIAKARLALGQTKAPSELAEDVTAIAMQNLADHMGRIRAKAIARAVLKFTAGKITQDIGKAVGGEAGGYAQLAGTAWNIGQAIAEEADKRSWVTLPARVNVSQLLVDPGEIDLKIEYLSDRSIPLPHLTQTQRVHVEAGKTTFLHVRTFR